MTLSLATLAVPLLGLKKQKHRKKKKKGRAHTHRRERLQVYGAGREHRPIPPIKEPPTFTEPVDTPNVVSRDDMSAFKALQERGNKHLQLVVRQALASAHPVLADPTSPWEGKLLMLARKAVSMIEPQDINDCRVCVASCDWVFGWLCVAPLLAGLCWS